MNNTVVLQRTHDNTIQFCSFVVVIISGLAVCSISDGYIFGQMSGMIDALKAADSPIPLNDNFISWIASTINITCICGYFLTGVLSKALGRRLSTSILGIPVLVCWVALYFAQDQYVILYTRIIVGMSYGGVLVQNIINCGEYIPPNLRQLVSNLINSFGTLAGIMCGHIFSLLMDWRIVALIGLIPSGLACLLPLLWIESPSWLASKGKFDQCEKAFRAIRSNNEDDEAELQYLIAYEKKNQSEFARHHSSRSSDLKKIIFACKKLYFWKITLLIIVVNIYRAVAGRIVLSTLAITMLQEIAGRSDILLFTILVDGFGLIGAAFSFYFVKKYTMRGLLFTSGIISNSLLVALSASLYFVPNEGWYPWVKVAFMAAYYIVVIAGPYPVLDVYLGEVNPLEIKEFSFFISGSLAGVIHFLVVKFASSMFATLGYSGVFILNAGVVTCCLIFLWFYMPETKGRTLQQIEVYLKTGKFEDLKGEHCTDVLMSRTSNKTDIL